jgi:hypothetical protein
MKENRARFGAPCFVKPVLDATAANQSHPVNDISTDMHFGRRISRQRHSRIGGI